MQTQVKGVSKWRMYISSPRHPACALEYNWKMIYAEKIIKGEKNTRKK